MDNIRIITFDRSDTDKDDGRDSKRIADNLSKKQLLADADFELEYVRPQPVISIDQPSSSETQ